MLKIIIVKNGNKNIDARKKKLSICYRYAGYMLRNFIEQIMWLLIKNLKFL